MNGNGPLRSALHTCLERNLTFAAFRTPGNAVELWAQRTHELETVDGSLMWELNEVFVIAPFNLDPARVPFIRADVELLFGEFGPDIGLLQECEGTPFLSSSVPAATNGAEFLKSVEAARQACADGSMAKVVLSRVMHAEVDRNALVELFLHALEEHPAACVALSHTPAHGTWLGASPERLVWEEEDHVRVDALAGTRSPGQAGEAERAWPEKEKHEQQVVADSVLNTLTGLGLENITRAETITVRAGNMDHLCTRFEADLGARTLSDVVLALHPTPAVCGSPTAAARSFIEQQERHDRGLYTGFWGPWNPDGRTELFVNIRCMHAVKDMAALFVGAGITKDSQPELEWEETERKAGTWLKPLKALR